MRPTGLALLAVLALPAPALAANADVSVGDDFFDAATVRIEPGDSVTWRWTGSNSHNVVAAPNQTMSFRSRLQRSGSYARSFPDRGRFTYVCEIHPAMRGAVEVGAAPFPDTLLPRVAAARARVARRTARVGFRLSERARVRVALSGPSRRVTTRLLARGSRAIAFRGLRPGRYRATLRATDTAGNRGRAVRTAAFSVR